MMHSITRNQSRGRGPTLVRVLLLAAVFAVIFTLVIACDTGSGGGGKSDADNNSADSIVGTWRRVHIGQEDQPEGEFIFYLNFKGNATSGPLEFWEEDNDKVDFSYTYNASILTLVDQRNDHLIGIAVLSNNNKTLTISGYSALPYSDSYVMDGSWTRVN
jgi:hypothetical protein